MTINKVDIASIPVQFIVQNLTKYQIEMIEQRYHIFNRYTELRKKKSVTDACIIISEEVGLQMDTVYKIINGVSNRLILSIK